MFSVIFDGYEGFCSVIFAVSDAGVFHGARNACVFCGFELVFDRQKALFNADAGIQNLSRRRIQSDIQSIVITDLPTVKSALLAQVVNATFHREQSLIDAKASHGAVRNVVGIDGFV